ncbi:MAG: hypothetical protein ACE5F9_01265 [Phycisphaerae bacterium]
MGPWNIAGIKDAYADQAKQQVMNMWAAQPEQAAGTFEEVQALAENIAIDSRTDLTGEQLAALRSTVAEFVAIRMLPLPEGADRLVAFHTARGGRPNLKNTLVTYRYRRADDPSPPQNVPQLIRAIWHDRRGNDAVWSAICPDGCQIFVRQIHERKEVFDFRFFTGPNVTYPLGLRSIDANRGGSVYYDAVRTLDEALEANADHTALLANVTLLARQNNPRYADKAVYPITVAFHWEPLVRDWVFDVTQMPLFAVARPK